MTDESNYAIGQPIEITYTETNTTSEPMSLNTAPSDFSITQAGFGTLLANVPATWGVTSDTATLLPGQSISETATWNGVANVGSLAGTNVWNSVIISNPTAPAGLCSNSYHRQPTCERLDRNESELRQRPAGHADVHGH